MSPHDHADDCADRVEVDVTVKPDGRIILTQGGVVVGRAAERVHAGGGAARAVAQ